MNPLAKLRLPLFVLLLIMITGTIGYRVMYPVTLIDAFYMTVIAISTVGFREVFPLDPAGKLFTVFLILSGLGGMTFTLSYLFQFMIEGHLLGMVKRRHMEKSLEAMKDHYIICGFGRVGEQIARDFEKAGKRFVVIDENPEALQRIEKSSRLYVVGNATSDDTLKKAGIERAKGLVAASDSDPDNVLTTLSAKMLNPAIFIVARASRMDVFEKLYKAGANRVLSPYHSTGQKMAAMLIKPLVHEYLDSMAYGTDLEIRLEELELPEEAEIVGKTIQESAIRKRTGTTILAIKKGDGRILTNPEVSTILDPKDRLVLVGTPEQLEEATRMLLPENRASAK
jgi:voltage-gated potassium channel